MRLTFCLLSFLFIFVAGARTIDDYNRYWNDILEFPCGPDQKTSAKADTKSCTLIVQCASYDRQKYSSTGWMLYGGEVPRMGSCAPNFKGSARNLTPGNYCFIATFFKRNVPGTSMAIIAYDLSITGDTTIVLDPAKTDKEIVFRSVYPDNSEPVLPVMPPDFEQTGELDYSKANTRQVFWTIAIDNDDFGHVANFGGSMSVQSEDDMARLDKCGVSISELGENWHISMTRYMENLKNEYYVTHSSINGTSKTPLINKPDFIEYAYKFADNPIKELGNKGIPYEIILHNTLNGLLNTGAAGECYAENPRLFLSQPMGVPTIHYTSNYAVEFKKNDAVMEPEPFWFQKYGIISPPILWDNETNGLAYGISGGDTDSFVYWQGPGHVGPTVIPGNPSFATSTLTQQIPLGESVPVAVTALLDNRLNDNIVIAPCLQWLGLYSEIRQSDILWTDVDLKYGKETISCNASQLADTLQYLGINQRMEGQCEITWENKRNIRTKDLVGFNKTLVTVKDVKGLDINPPSVTMMQFRNSVNEVTNDFETSEGALLEISGGDFFLYGRAWLCSRPDIKIEYAYENSGEYKEIIPEEIEANFVMPSFGYFWRGKLDNANEKGAYTLRLTLNDSAGNTQVQTIYPAFFIKRSTGLRNTGACDEDHIIYFDLQGNRIDRPSAGQPVIRICDGEARKIIFK